MNYVRGLKYILNGFRQSQKEISQFIQKCKDLEDKDGYIYEQFYDLKINSNYKLSSGPLPIQFVKLYNYKKIRLEL